MRSNLVPVSYRHKIKSAPSGFPTGVGNMGEYYAPLGGGSSTFDGGNLSQCMGRAWGGFRKIYVKEFIYSKVAGYRPTNLLKMNFFTHIFQGS